MPQVVRVQVTLNPSADPRGQFVNTWHIVTVGATTTSAASDAFTQDLNAFYQTVDGQMSGDISGAVPFARCFDLSDPKPRQPVWETAFTALVCAGTTMPHEVACCLSYRGVYTSGVSPKRRRGRIYLGPLADGAVNSSTGKLHSTLVGLVAGAGDDLLQLSLASTEYHWCVYSPASDPDGTGNDTACFHSVIAGWVDDEPDIQRRRSAGSVGVKTPFS